MYIPSWIDGPILLAAFMVVYEIFRKNYGWRTIWNLQFMVMAFSVGWMALTVIVNRNETIMSVPFFVGSVLALAVALYIRWHQPKKLPTEPSLD